MSGTDYTTTPNLGLFKPTYDMDDEQWGAHLNQNADMLDAYLSPGGTALFVLTAGSAMTGPLILSGSPTAPAQAASKSYVDTTLGAISGTLIYQGGWDASANVPTLASGALANGVLQPSGRYFLVIVGATTAAIDGITTWVAGDWIVSNGSVWQRTQNSTSPYLPLAGGTMGGRLTLAVPPVNPLDAATKAYVDSSGAAGGPFLPLAGGTISGQTVVGTNTAAAALVANGPAGSARPLFWSTAGLSRWELRANATGETGSNAGSDLDLFAYTDAGAVLGQVQRFTRSTGGIVWNNNLSFANPIYNAHGGSITADKTFGQQGVHTFTSGAAPGIGGTSPMGFVQNCTFTGVMDTGSGAPNFNNIQTTDTMVTSRTLPFTSQWAMSHSYNAGASGDRAQLSLTYAKNAAAADGLAVGPFNLICFMHCDVGESTNPAAPLSRASNVNFDTRIGGTGYAWATICVQENDLRVFAGNTVVSKGNISVHNGISDAVHGSAEDYAISFTNSPQIPPGTGGNKTLLQLGAYGQNLPWDPLLAGTSIMQVMGNATANLPTGWNPTVDLGFDLWGLDFNTAVLRACGITIDGAGQMPVLGPGAITYSTSGIRIATPNVRAVSATVAAGGSAYKVNDVLVDTMGNLWRVATVTGNAVATVALKKTNYAAAAPANPVATQFGTGNGCTLNVTTAATGTLTLGDAAQIVKVAGRLNVAGIPTSSSGLVSGDVWSNAGVLTVVP